MTNNDFLLGMSNKSRLRAQVTYLMMKGASYAAAVFFSIWIFVALLAWFGRTVLPEDAQLAADPAPLAFVDMAAQAAAEDAAAMTPAPASAPAEDAAVTANATAPAAEEGGTEAPAAE